MASPRTSRLRFRNTRGEPLAAPVEWEPALVEVAVAPGDFQSTRLLRQGQRLELFVKEVDGAVRVLAEWPRSETGSHRLTLEVEGESEELIITITPRKITEDAYRALIDDLQGERLPTSIAIGLERTGGLSGLELRPRDETTLNQELFRLRRAVEGSDTRAGLASVLTAIARDPHRVLVKTELWVPAERVRRLEPVGLMAAIRVPENVDSTSGGPLHVPDVRVEHTVDVYENRLLKLYSEQVALRLRRLTIAFEANRQFAAVAESETLLERLVVARRAAAFLEDVTLPAHPPTRVTMVLLRSPPYRAGLEGYLELQREAYVQLDEPALDAPLDNLPGLYELWGTLQVIDVLLEVAGEAGFETRRQRLARQFGHGVYIRVLPDGEAAVELVHQDRRVVELIPQRSFSRTGRPLRSISFAQRPDVVVEVRRPNSRPVLRVFDPKYKLQSEEERVSAEDELDPTEPAGRPKKIDIDRMHAYRDAIRDTEGTRVVHYAAILYPGPARQYGDGIEALSAIPSARAALRDRVREVLVDTL